MKPYLLTVTLVTGIISQAAFAGDIVRHKNEFLNEQALGYQFGFNDTYHVAFEVFGQNNNKQELPSPYDLSEQNPIDNLEFWNDEAKADFDWTTGVRLRPGYNVTKNTRLFLDGGVVWGDYSMELTEFNASLDPDNTPSEMLRGFRYGAGIEHHIPYMNAFSVVLDYSMTEFEDAQGYSANYFGNTNELDSDPLNGPSYQQVMLSLKAEFDSGLGF